MTQITIQMTAEATRAFYSQWSELRPVLLIWRGRRNKLPSFLLRKIHERAVSKEARESHLPITSSINKISSLLRQRIVSPVFSHQIFKGYWEKKSREKRWRIPDVRNSPRWLTCLNFLPSKCEAEQQRIKSFFPPFRPNSSDSLLPVYQLKKGGSRRWTESRPPTLIIEQNTRHQLFQLSSDEEAAGKLRLENCSFLANGIQSVLGNEITIIHYGS